MIVTPRADLAELVLRPRPSTGRERGVHLSGIIQAMLKRIDPKKYAGPRDPIRMGTYIAGGLAFEQILEDAIRQALFGTLQIERPPSMELDGVHMNADGISVELRHWELHPEPEPYVMVHEFKMTWMSSREFPHNDKFWKYFTQIKGYCKLFDTTLARLWVYWVNGDYSTHQPVLMAYDLVFTQREIDDNWNMLLNHRELAEKE